MTAGAKKLDMQISEKYFDIWVLLEQSSFAVARARDLELSQYGLTPAQASVLYALIKYGGKATQAEIGDFTLRQHHSVSTLVNRMMAQDLVKKIKEPKSKRSKVEITEKGRTLYTQSTKSSIEMIFSVLSSNDRQVLASYLASIREKARSLLGLDFKPPFLPQK